MEFQGGQFAMLLLLMFVALSYAQTNEIDIRSSTYCVLKPNNVMLASTRFYDINDQAIRFQALDVNNATQDSCDYSGSGTQGAPWVVETDVNLNTNTENNPCGMEVISPVFAGNPTLYRWRFRAYAYEEGQPFIARAFLLYATCDPTHASEDGRVETDIEFRLPNMDYALPINSTWDESEALVPYGIYLQCIIDIRHVLFYISPKNPNAVTGSNTYATGATLVVAGAVYPDGDDTPDALKNAKGYFVSDCYSSTSINMQENREQCIDTNGCPVPGAAVAPANGFRKTSEPGATPIEFSSEIVATTVGGKKTVYIQCVTSVCEDDNNQYCDDPCAAHNAGVNKDNVRSTGIPFQSSYNVEDVEGQVLYPASVSDLLAPLITATEESRIVLVMRGHPYGLASTGALRRAMGFFVHSCYYATNKNFNNRVEFINNIGCPVTSALLNPSEGFKPDQITSDPDTNMYGLKTGPATVKRVPGNRLWVRCSTGICTSSDHNYCRLGRCGATDNIPGEALDLGYTDLSFLLSVIRSDDPAVGVETNLEDGTVIDDNTQIFTGEGVGFKVIIIPGGSGNGAGLVQGAAGTFVHSCDATIEATDGSTETYRVIDEHGCRVTIPGSPVTLSQECIDATEVEGVGPFVTDCGEVETSRPGKVSMPCRIGICREPGDLTCKERCKVGPLQANATAINLDNVSTPAAQFSAKQAPEGNTAETSDRIRNMIIGACVAAPVVFCGVVGVLSWMSLKFQKSGKVC